MAVRIDNLCTYIYLLYVSTKIDYNIDGPTKKRALDQEMCRYEGSPVPACVQLRREREE